MIRGPPGRRPGVSSSQSGRDVTARSVSMSTAALPFSQFPLPALAAALLSRPPAAPAPPLNFDLVVTVMCPMARSTSSLHPPGSASRFVSLGAPRADCRVETRPRPRVRAFPFRPQKPLVGAAAPVLARSGLIGSFFAGEKTIVRVAACEPASGPRERDHLIFFTWIVLEC